MMRDLKFFKIIGLGFYLLLLTACATQVHYQQVEPAQIKLNSEKVFISLKKPRFYSDEYSQTASTLIALIKQKNSSVKDFSTSTKDGIKAELTITDFNYVSAEARIIGGILVGRARLQVNVIISNLKTGEQISEASFGTFSKHSQGIFGGNTPRQIEAVAEAISKYLNKV